MDKATAHHLTDAVPTGLTGRGRTSRELEQGFRLEGWKLGEGEVRAAIRGCLDRGEGRYVDGGPWRAVGTSGAA